MDTSQLSHFHGYALWFHTPQVRWLSGLGFTCSTCSAGEDSRADRPVELVLEQLANTVRTRCNYDSMRMITTRQLLMKRACEYLVLCVRQVAMFKGHDVEAWTDFVCLKDA